jgi:Ca-activated chloride channel family protein
MKKHKVQRLGSVGILLALTAVVMMGSFTLLGTRVESQVFSQINMGLTIREPAAIPAAPRPKAKSAGTYNDGLEPAVEPTVERTPQPVEVNPFTLTSQDHLSTFGLDVDTASYTAARNYITDGSLPPESEVRVEEFINYFDYGYTPPQEDALTIALDAAPLPWTSIEGQQTHLVRVGIQGKHIDDSERDDASLIFVIDVSGSMAEPNRLPMVKESLTLLVEKLRETDQVGIVIYSDDTRVVLEPTSAAKRNKIRRAINSLEIEGATNVEAGLRLGYELAAEHFKVGGINRVILCSDGVANVGETGPDAIREVIRDHTAQGVLLTTVGFGMGDYNDYLMEQLADDGNGNYAYVDTLDEARRVFVENLTGMLQVIAKDAKVQVDFNPNVVQSYRLLGYENRAIADEDFRNEKVDAGEVGVDHNVTALYEVVLNEQASGDAITVYLRYKHPQSGKVTELEQPLATDAFGTSFDEMSPQFRLAVAVAGFAEQLRGSGYAQDRSMADILAIAEPVAQEMANDAEVQEFVHLVRQASNL